MNGRIIFALLLTAAATLAQELPDGGDAHVNSLYPDVNFGSLPFLQVGGTTRAFVKFDLSVVPAGSASSSVSSATLILWVGRVANAGEIQISQVAAPWNEATVTYATAPASGALVTTFPVSLGWEFVTVDVTAAVQEWLQSPQSDQGFALSAAPQAPTTVVFFDSKESVSTSHAPVLELSFEGGVGPQGNQGAQGAPGQPGARGPAGLTGAASTVPGPTGPAGPIGPRGPEGAASTVAGPIGPAGPAGAASTVAGPTGPAGPVGPAGAASTVAGPIGPRGPAGAASTVAGPTGPAGPAGAASTVAGPTGPAGPAGAASTVAGPTGPAGPAGAASTVAGPTGPAGPAGAASTVAGPTGPTGPAGPAGATGATGPAGGLSEYGYVYNLGAQVVPVGAAVVFDTNGILTGGITHTAGLAPLTITDPGDYKVSFSISGVEPNQFTVFLNGVPLTGATYGSGAGTQQNVGQVIVTLAMGDVVTIQNYTSAAAVTLQTLAGGSQTSVNASVVIEKLN